ncbi:MAG: hypothetical protein F6K65_43980, partial [Moorea sp. SIO3C2]|nr:hypothetical protein [Moorena sp. SIO3C2]
DPAYGEYGYNRSEAKDKGDRLYEQGYEAEQEGSFEIAKGKFREALVAYEFAQYQKGKDKVWKALKKLEGRG